MFEMARNTYVSNIVWAHHPGEPARFMLLLFDFQLNCYQLIDELLRYL